MKEIELTQDQVAIVDDWDYEHLNQWKWYAVREPRANGEKYYPRRDIHLGTVNGKRKKQSRYMTREIMKPPKEMVVINLNHDTLDCRKENLLVVSRAQAKQHRNDGKSKYTGVHWDKRSKKWVAKIKIKYYTKYLGEFKDEKEAFKAYEKALCELTGEQPVCRLKAKKKAPSENPGG